MKKLVYGLIVLALALTACMPNPALSASGSVLPGIAQVTATPDEVGTAVQATLNAMNLQTATPEVNAVVDEVPEFVQDLSHGAWTINATERLAANPIIADWISRLKDPAPQLWKTFPNIPNKDVPEFKVVNCESVPSKQCVPDGMEYGTYSSPYCWQSPCDVPVGAWEYRYISGDYQILGMDCVGNKKTSCMFVFLNEGDESYTWRNQYVDNGFTLRGRYFNGDALEWGVWGLVSHGAANMLNMETWSHPDEVLNSGQIGNSGANCGVPGGCQEVDVTVVVTTGDAILAVLRTIVVHP